MLSNKVTFGVIALVAMVGAAGAGSWFASRGTAPAGKPAAAAVTTPPSTIPAVGGAVEATEAVMDDKEAASAGSDRLPLPPDRPPSGGPGCGGQGCTATSRRTSPRPLSPRPSRGPLIGRSRPSRRLRRGRQSNRQETSTPRTRPRRRRRGRRHRPRRLDAHAVETDRASAEPVAPPPPPPPQYLEVTVPADSVIGLQIETALSSETAHVEDRVDARVTRDVMRRGRVAIPAGSRVLGSVTRSSAAAR